MSQSSSSQPISFTSFNLHASILRALADLGFESPSPIQEQSIPVLLQGKDIIAQAQTGTGKTAAFALPILQNLQLDSKNPNPQALVLAPTRELAIQVAEAFQSYAKYLPGFHVAPIYGGQDYQQQLRALKRGVHVIVGTPGRIMDHMRRGTLVLTNIKTLVLDEADEMLRMGFLENVQWILEQMPQAHQAALFSATIPNSIRTIANTYLEKPEHIKVKTQSMTAASITQSAMLVNQKNKLEALTRYLEVEEFGAALIFARTKNMAAELADKLAARGYSAAALHGDMSQSMREKVIERIKRNALDIIVATDVAARGLDVERITHVINFDAPYDAETYTHRIGRTGRAGRTGISLMILTPRERHFLRDIERATNQAVAMIDPPSANHLRKSRIEAFTAHMQSELSKGNLDPYRELVERLVHASESSMLDIAAALLKIAQKNKPLLVQGEVENLDATDEPDTRKRAPRRGGAAKFGSKPRPRSFSPSQKPGQKKEWAGKKKKPKTGKR